jgi:hypothetical protein
VPSIRRMLTMAHLPTDCATSFTSAMIWPGGLLRSSCFYKAEVFLPPWLTKNWSIERACENLSAQKCNSLRNPWVFATMVVLKTGLVHELVQDQTVGIHQDMALAAFDLLASVIAAPPLLWLVFTDWLSIIAALGVGSRPCFTRTCSRSAVWMRSHVPSVRHVRK